MRVPGWVKAIGLALAVLAGIVAGALFARRLVGQEGTVSGNSLPWIPSPKTPREILVQLPGDPEPARVALPEGLAAEDIKAVAAAPASGAAIVEVHQAVRDRRAMLAGKGGG